MVERLLIAKWAEDPFIAAETALHFKSVLEVTRIVNEAKAEFKAAHDKWFEQEKKREFDRIRRNWAKIAGPFRAIWAFILRRFDEVPN